MVLRTSPLSSALGIEVHDLDLAGDVAAHEIGAIQVAWRRHHLVLFRDQHLDPDDQLRVAAWFGSPATSPFLAEGGTPTVGHISNRVEGGVGGDGELLAHSDFCYTDTPLRAISLYAIDVPASGGDTIFANCIVAYRQLPPSLRARIDGLEAVHVFDYRRNRGDRRVRLAEVETRSPRAVHPVVMRFAELDEPVLYVNRLMTDSILGLSEDASESLLDELLSYVDGPSVVYRHRWRPGDLVVWDNRCLLHARTDFDEREARTLRRVAIADTPAHEATDAHRRTR